MSFRKQAFGLIVLTLVSLGVTRGYALFIDPASAKDNIFYSGSYDVQVSTTDSDNNNIADAAPALWSDAVVGAWTTPIKWIPGQTVNSRVFIRNRGDVDAESLRWHLTNRSFYGDRQLDQAILLTDAWYDRNSNGVKEAEDDLLPSLKAAYDRNGGTFTMRELFDGTDLVHGGTAFDLENGPSVLPGTRPNDSVGGYGGTGKGLFLTWQYDPTADSGYNNAWVELDFVFTGEQRTEGSV